MKSNSLYLTLTMMLLLTSNVYAENTNNLIKEEQINIANPSKIISIKTTLKDKNDEIILSNTTNTTDSTPSPIKLIKETTYIKKISGAKKDLYFQIETDYITAGLNITNTPTIINDTNINIHTSGVQQELISLLNQPILSEQNKTPNINRFTFDFSQSYHNNETVVTKIGGGYKLEITPTF